MMLPTACDVAIIGAGPVVRFHRPADIGRLAAGEAA